MTVTVRVYAVQFSASVAHYLASPTLNDAPFIASLSHFKRLMAIAVSAVGSELRSKAPPAVSRRRRNILIAAEEIVGIVAILEPPEAGEILAVG
jgi:hypothetical protein